jgi:bacillopeptidase F (M6 metalloprotease family)
MFKVISKLTQRFRKVISTGIAYVIKFIYWVKKPFLTFVKLVISGIALGIVIGIVVAYLFSIPVISLTQTKVRIDNDKIDLGMDLENKGQSKACNVVMCYFYWDESSVPDEYHIELSNTAEVVGVGDVFSYTARDLNLHKKGDQAIIFLMVKFTDKSRIRQFINEHILGNDYYLERWMYHKNDKKILSALDQSIKEKFQSEFRKKMLQLF